MLGNTSTARIGNKTALKILFLSTLLITASNSHARDFFGNWGGSNRYGYDDNDWPEWTPMYWMEEMFDDDDDDRYGGRYSRYGGGFYPDPYQSFYSPYGYGPNPYLANPYSRSPYARNPYARSPYARSPYARSPYARSPYTRSPYRGLPRSRSIAPSTRFPNISSSYFNNPLNQFYGNRSPFSSFGGGSPWNSFSSPFSSPLSSPFGGGLGGLGSPLSPMSPMSPMSPLGGGMGLPGMSPWGGGMGLPGMSPWGGSSMPFSGGGFPFR